MTQTMTMVGFEINRKEGTVTFELEQVEHFPYFDEDGHQDYDLESVEYIVTFYLKDPKRGKYARKYLDQLVWNNEGVKRCIEDTGCKDRAEYISKFGYQNAYNEMIGTYVEVEEKWLRRPDRDSYIEWTRYTT